MDIPDNKYLGRLCKRGHEFENTGKTMRNGNGTVIGGCVKCQKEKGLRYYHKNKDKMAKSNKLWWEAHPEKKSETAKRFYYKNLETIRANAREKYDPVQARNYRLNNLEAIKENQREYYMQNREKIIKRTGLYFLEHKPIRHCECGKVVSNHRRLCEKCSPVYAKIAYRKGKLNSKQKDVIYAKKSRETLSDNYVRGLIGIHKADITSELIEVKRLQIKIDRFIRKGVVING